MIRFNERTQKYEVVYDNFVYTFKTMQEAMEFVASARGR